MNALVETHSTPKPLAPISLLSKTKHSTIGVTLCRCCLFVLFAAQRTTRFVTPENALLPIAETLLSGCFGLCTAERAARD